MAGMLAGTLFTVVDLFGAWITARFSAWVIACLAVVLVSIWFPDRRPEAGSAS
jgi:hypothetical protein